MKRHRLKPSLFKPAITTVISLEKANMMVLPANKGANNCVSRIRLKEKTAGQTVKRSNFMSMVNSS